MSQENKITRKSKQFSAANIYMCRPGCFDAVKFRESKHSTERQSHQRQDFSSLVLVSQFDLQETLGHDPGSLTLMRSIEPGSYLVHTGSDTGTCFLLIKLRLTDPGEGKEALQLGYKSPSSHCGCHFGGPLEKLAVCVCVCGVVIKRRLLWVCTVTVQEDKRGLVKCFCVSFQCCFKESGKSLTKGFGHF